MTHDVQSCVINLVLGIKRPLDLISIHDMEQSYKFIRMAGLNASASTFNLAMQRLEKFRFLGPFRYLLFLVVLVFGIKRLSYDSYAIKKVMSESSGRCIVEEVDGKVGPCDDCVERVEQSGEWEEVGGIDRKTVGSIEFVVHMLKFPVKGITNSFPAPHL